MSHTISIRLTKELAQWLERVVHETGIPAGRLIREQLERLRETHGSQQFMKHAGKMSGPSDLSTRKGFSRS